MAMTDLAPDAPTEKIRVFTIPADKLKQFDEFVREHDKTCKLTVRDVSCVSKYMFTFRPSGLGDNIHIVCLCGEKYYADAGSDMI